MANPTNNPGSAAATRRYATRSGKACRRQSFIDADVTPEQVQRYLFEATDYDQFLELVQEHLEEALPALWACRNEWVEHQQNDPEQLEKLQQELESVRRENDLRKELLSVYQNTSATVAAQRAALPVEDPVDDPTPVNRTASPTTTSAGDRPRAEKTSKIPDAPVFKDGQIPTFDAWRRAIRNKLRSNYDHYPTEEAKLGYVLSRVEQPASDILEPYLDDDAVQPITTHTQVLEALEKVYGTPNKEYMYQGQFERLEQRNSDFNSFVAEFYRLAAPLRRDENSLLSSFRRKLSPTMQRYMIGRPYESLESLIEFCRRVDDDLKLQQQQSRRNITYAPFSRSSTRTVTPATPSTPNPVRKTATAAPTGATIDPNTFVRASTPRANVTFEEREQLKAQGRCFLCKQPGHIASECPPQNPRVNAVDEQEQEQKQSEN
jgi:Zinc knuckle